MFTGKVRRLTDFGAFVDLGGVEGMIPISELSHVRIGHPSEVVKVGDRVRVKVMNVDLARKRMGLSIKALQAAPAHSGGQGPGPSGPQRKAEPFNAPRRR